MQGTTIRPIVAALILASSLAPAACGKSTPTSPTQAGPTVTTTTTTTPTATPTPAPQPQPQPPIIDVIKPEVTLTGTVANLTRGGANGLDITFRIDDSTIVRANANTPVTSGSATGRTDFIRNGQRVSATGIRANGFLDATSLSIIAQAP